MNLDSLQSLSTTMLLEMAGRLGLEIPSGLERPFIIEEILEAQEDERTRVAESSLNSLSNIDNLPSDPLVGTEQGDKGEAPNAQLRELRYNESSIQAILKDPAWAYLYWDLREDELRDLPEADPHSVCIRVLKLSSPQEAAKNALSWFDFCVSPHDGEWYVNLPEDGLCYVFELSVSCGRERKVLARSNVIKAPKFRSYQEYQGLPRKTRSLMELGGFYEYLPSQDAPQSMAMSSRGKRILPISEIEE